MNEYLFFHEALNKDCELNQFSNQLINFLFLITLGHDEETIPE